MRIAAAFAIAAAAGIAAVGADGPSTPALIHEWGTFTSVAGPDGRAVEWMPQAGVSDLPCFVVRDRLKIKGSLRGTVRMETPVIYFYAPGDTRADVRVHFRGGLITEFFPPASVSTDHQSGGSPIGSIRWPNVRVRPASEPDFPIEPGPSHYYQARATDAAPVDSGAARERFLFYRGVGTFAPPIDAAVSGDGSVLVTRRSGAPIGDVILFENYNGTPASQVLTIDSASALLEPPEPQHDGTVILLQLERILIANGLFEREAHAMVETWRDSWFEEGARLMYIVPRPFVDSILPLDINPEPSALTRVFVGRIELFTPETLRIVGDAFRDGDRDVLARYGRFLDPIAQRLGVRTEPTVPTDSCADGPPANPSTTLR
jgi:hypothetical protein